MSIRTRDQLVQWLVSKETRQNRINAKCVDCIYDEALGTNWRKQVSDCLVTDCPLYPIRPMSSVYSRTAQTES